MSVRDRVRWDNVYKRNISKPFPPPDPLLLQFTPPIPVDADPLPRALDLAAGLGQNGLWLAEQGYAVDIMDISRVALTRARSEMMMRNLRNVNLLQVDVDQIELAHRNYHVVCVFRYLRRDLFDAIRKSVIPGGRVVYSTFNLRYLEEVPGFNRDFLLEEGEILDVFSGWEIIHYEEVAYESHLIALRPPQ